MNMIVDRPDPAVDGPVIKMIPIDDIKRNRDVQPRKTKVPEDVVREYVEAMRAGTKFPPLVVFHDGQTHWLADGFTRHLAAKGADLTAFPCEVRSGGQRDAMLHACGANADHGQRRTDEDKRRVVLRMLTDEEWRRQSNMEIARQCRVSEGLVRKVRNELEPKPSSYDTKIGDDQPGHGRDSTRTVRRGNSTYQQDTRNIGKSLPAGPSPGSDASATPSTAPQPVDEKPGPTEPSSPDLIMVPSIGTLSTEIEARNAIRAMSGNLSALADVLDQVLTFEELTTLSDLIEAVLRSHTEGSNAEGTVTWSS